MRIIESSNTAELDAFLSRDRKADRAFDRRVQSIIDRVRSGGDRALLAYAKKFDRLEGPMVVTEAEMRAAAKQVPRDVRQAIREAARNIARVAARQVPKSTRVTVAPGVRVEQRVSPLARVGCYVPGGRFPLPSSLLMTAIPARVAGVRDIVAVCPRPEPAVMAAALEAGVSTLLRIGGAHAVAALAYGTESLPRVDKIVGPGNRYVATAKALVAADCSIDLFAGPSEIVIVAGSGKATWIASDLVAQAEHDPDARAIFVTWSRPLAERVMKAATRLAKGLPVAEASLAANGAVIVVPREADAMPLVNRLAPEHLVLEHERLAKGQVVAGAVFVGPHTAQAAGDYATGSNHVLPTSGAARFRGGLSAADFVRTMAVQRLTPAGLKRLSRTILPLAGAEGLVAHARSIEVRLT